MKMDLIAKNSKENDEYYTYSYAIYPLLKYLKPKSKILCPFDMKWSKFVDVFTNEGFVVEHSHLNEGKDFFQLEKPNVDYIISNPPYSMKKEVFEKLFSWDVPFAMLVGLVGLFQSKDRFELFSKNKFEILFFNKRIGYNDFSGKSHQAPFESGYICHNILPERIMFERIEN